MPNKQAVKLTRKERRELLKVVKTGRHSARKIGRAHVLLKSNEGWTDKQIAEAFDSSLATVRRIRLKCLTVGALEGIEEEARSGQPKEISDEEEQMLVALACSSPPPGQSRWTVRLLTSEAVVREFIHKVVPETVRQVLQKTKSNLGKSGVGVNPRSMMSF